MALQTSTLNSTQYTDIRDNHAVTAYVVPNPNTVVLEARVNGTPSGASFAQVSFDTVTSGSYSNVKEGFTVLFCKTNDKRKYYLRTRARKAPTSSILYISRNSESITDNDYIFVIKDVGLHRKAPRDVNGVVYYDEDIAFRQGLPIITNLESAYFKISTTNWDFSFTPTALATASGATISSWLWDADGGSFQSGTSTSQNVTIRFTATGVYWVRLTVTDSGGRSNWFTFRVCCENTSLSGITALGIKEVQYSKNLEGGCNASISVQADSHFSDMLDLTQIAIFTSEKYQSGTTPILTSLKFTGVLRNPQVTMDSNEYGITSSISYQVEGMKAQLDRLRLATIAILDKDSPTVYGEVKDLTLWRAFTLVATELMTLSHICAISFDSTSNDYRVDSIGTNKSDKGGGMLDSIAEPNNAVVNYLPSGELYIARHYDFLSTSERSSVVKCADLTDADWTGQLDISYDPAPKIAILIAYGGTYNTTSKTVDVYRATAPAQSWGDGESQEQLNRQVLPSNLTVAQASSALASRAGSAYASKNPRYTLNAQFSGGYNFMQPISNQKWTFTVDQADNDLGLAFDTSNYWILQNVSVTYNIERYTMGVTATFLSEVKEASSLVFVEPAPEDAPYIVPVTPPLPPYNPDLFEYDPNLWYPDGEIPTADYGAEVTTNPESWNNVQRPSSPKKKKDNNQKLPAGGCKALTVSFRDPNVKLTAFQGTNGKAYKVSLSGEGKLSDSFWSKSFDFTASDGGWLAAVGSNGYARASYTAGVGWDRVYGNPLPTAGNSENRIYIDFNGIVTKVKIYFITPSGTGDNFIGYKILSSPPPQEGDIETVAVSGFTTSGTGTYTYNGNFNTGGRLRVDLTLLGADAQVTITRIDLEGTGTAPAFATGTTLEYRGDAFYYYPVDGSVAPLQYSTGAGLLIDGANPSAPAYNANHQYVVDYTGDGTNISFVFSDAAYADNSNDLIYIQICSADGSNVP
jgi:PKD repeat protein